jgi:hypothetical protein
MSRENPASTESAVGGSVRPIPDGVVRVGHGDYLPGRERVGQGAGAGAASSTVGLATKPGFSQLAPGSGKNSPL